MLIIHLLTVITVNGDSAEVRPGMRGIDTVDTVDTCTVSRDREILRVAEVKVEL